jgi:hypothetical protein
MTAPRPPKKSETLEIRIPYPDKQAFMARCRLDGTSASEALRALVDAHLEGDIARPAPSQAAGPGRILLHLAAGALIAAAAGAVALPSLAHPACASAAWTAITAPLPSLSGKPPVVHLVR